MSSIVSYCSYDYEPIEILPVIASFDTSGHITPLYVRKDGRPFRVDSFWLKSASGHTCTFQCKLQMEDHLQPIVLSYYRSEGIWGTPATSSEPHAPLP